LHRARGVRDVMLALVCQGYDIFDQAVYARLDSGGTEPLQARFEHSRGKPWLDLPARCWRWMKRR